MKDIKVSVIVPVYNVEKYLSQTLNTIINQTLKDIEIICVDDGSTDNSSNILKEYQKKDDRIHLIFQQNQYAGVARNNGLKQAEGKYVVFWDSDDLFHKKALELMYKQCEKDDADLCVCAADNYDSQSNKHIGAGMYLKKERLPKEIPFSKQTQTQYLFTFSTNVPWNKMWKKSFIIENDLQFQDLKQANDAYFVMMSYYYAERITIVDKVLMSYRINNNESLTGKASQTISCIYNAYLKIYAELKKQEDFNENILQEFHNKLINGILYALKIQTNDESFASIYNLIRESIVNDFILPLNEDYYYNKKDYIMMMDVLKYSSNEYLFNEYQKKNINNKLKRKGMIYKIYYSLYYSKIWKICSFFVNLIKK